MASIDEAQDGVSWLTHLVERLPATLHEHHAQGACKKPAWKREANPQEEAGQEQDEGEHGTEPAHPP
ncbi:MAG TPA: hypothetical protein VJQ79_04300 [Acidimicrobiia bacterium]|nr:hypothetical protein [Acidimicrobiia bacterium]